MVFRLSRSCIGIQSWSLALFRSLFRMGEISQKRARYDLTTSLWGLVKVLSQGQQSFFFGCFFFAARGWRRLPWREGIRFLGAPGNWDFSPSIRLLINGCNTSQNSYHIDIWIHTSFKIGSSCVKETLVQRLFWHPTLKRSQMSPQIDTFPLRGYVTPALLNKSL